MTRIVGGSLIISLGTPPQLLFADFFWGAYMRDKLPSMLPPTCIRNDFAV